MRPRTYPFTIEEIPALLRRLRKQMKWTTMDLAKESGISQSSISHYENGTKMPSADNLQKLLAVLRTRLLIQTTMTITDEEIVENVG